MVVLYHFLSPFKRVAVVAMDALLAAFLLATFVYGAYNAGQNKGACALPDKIGIWDNTRGCTRMTIATAFSAVNFGFFAASAVMATLL